MSQAHDLSAQLTLARDDVQTFRDAISLLADTDLLRLPGSANLGPAISGSSDPPAPWVGDEPLAEDYMRALRQINDCLTTLQQLDICTPYRPGMQPHRAAVIPLSIGRLRATTCDRALQAIQHHIAHLSYADQVIAIDSCAHITGAFQDLGHHPPRALDLPQWRTMAARARRECAWCGRDTHTTINLLCPTCRSGGTPCIGVPGHSCDQSAPEGHKRCGACRTRLSRMTNAQISAAS